MTAAPSRAGLEKAARDVLATGNGGDLTLRQVRSQVEKKLGLTVGRLSEEDWKQDFKAIVVELLQKRAVVASQADDAAEASADGDAASSEEEAPRKKSKKEGKKESKPLPKKRKAQAPAKDKDQLAKLRELGRAMNLGPRVYVGLKDLPPDEAFTVLATRLRDAGATFKGTLPTAQDIAAAKKKTDLAKSLDGIDTGLIIADTSRRRRAADAGDAARKEAALAAKAAAAAMASSSEEEEMEDGDGDDEEDGGEEDGEEGGEEGGEERNDEEEHGGEKAAEA